MDRIVLGQHANASIGAGLYVSKPGANVMHPEFAIAGNLTFDTNEHSSLHIIQTGTFKITCSRKAISARGETVGNRPNDVSEIFYDDATNDIAAHTFDEDTGRPSNMTTVANWDEAKNLGYLHKPAVGRQSRGKQTNYLDTGSKSITITSPLSGGEIPQVALNFAVGNSSGHFHPWYADVTTTGAGMDWDEWSYNDSTKIVHMDSSWMRLKWGGLGAEEYMGIQDEYYPMDQTNRRTYHDSLVAFFEGDADAAAANMGFSSSIDMENKLKNSKLLSSAINNSQGIVGLIPTVNSTTLTVDAYMTPTHAGLRQPVDRTYEKNKGRQKGVGFNAIDDYADINFSIDFLASQHPDHSESRALIGDITDTIISETINAKKFKHLPGIPTQGDIFRADGGDFDYEDHGKRDMYGWGGHPTEFFVNPFSNGTQTFYTHMQPPHFTDRIYGTNTAAPETTTNYGTYHQAWVGTYLPIGYEGEGKTSWFESVGGSYPGFSPFHTTWGPLISEQLGGPVAAAHRDLFWANTYVAGSVVATRDRSAVTDFFPSISLNGMGDTIYYMSNATDDGHTHIFKMDINGVTSTQITHNEDIITNQAGGTLGNKLGSGNFRPQGLAISPDETRIAWSLPMNNDGVVGPNGAELYVYYIEGKTLTNQAGVPTYQMDAGTHHWVDSEPTPWSAVAHKDHGNPIWIDDNTIGWTHYNQDGGASSRPIFYMRYAHEDWPNPAVDKPPWDFMTAPINHGNDAWPIYSTGFRLLDVGGGASGYSYTIVMRDSGDALGDIINMGLGDDREEYRGTVLSVMSTGADTFDKSKDDEDGMHNQSQDLTQRIEKAPNHWTSDNNAKLSPDNSEIVFDSLHRAGLDTREIYKMPFTAIVPPWNGGSVAPAAGWPTLTQLTDCGTGALSGFAKAHSPQWMPNGRILFYAETSGNDKWSGDIFTMAGDGTDIQNISTFSNKSIPSPTHWPNRTSFNGTGCHWPAGHVHADYFDYRDWTGSMGLDGAGSQESLSKEDCWDTFYCSYVIYSTGSIPLPEAALRPGAADQTDGGFSVIWDGYLGSDG